MTIHNWVPHSIVSPTYLQNIDHVMRLLQPWQQEWMDISHTRCPKKRKSWMSCYLRRQPFGNHSNTLKSYFSGILVNVYVHNSTMFVAFLNDIMLNVNIPAWVIFTVKPDGKSSPTRDEWLGPVLGNKYHLKVKEVYSSCTFISWPPLEYKDAALNN